MNKKFKNLNNKIRKNVKELFEKDSFRNISETIKKDVKKWKNNEDYSILLIARKTTTKENKILEIDNEIIAAISTGRSNDDKLSGIGYGIVPQVNRK